MNKISKLTGCFSSTISLCMNLWPLGQCSDLKLQKGKSWRYPGISEQTYCLTSRSPVVRALVYQPRGPGFDSWHVSFRVSYYKGKNSNDTAATYQVFVNYMLIKIVCNEDGLLWKRPPLKWQPLFGSYSNLKLKIRWLNFIVQILKIKTTSNGRRLTMEDNLQWKTTSNRRWPKIIKLS